MATAGTRPAGRVLTGFLSSPRAYRLWQAPFAEAKFAPIPRHNNLNTVHRVLDVGCGPGTNAHHFESVEYLGIDSNARYIDYARKRSPGSFMVVDVTELVVAAEERFDFVLVNSLLHHLPDDDVALLLAHLSSLLTDDGRIHIMELELPSRRSVARFLAQADRGDFPRSLTRWRELLTRSFECEVFEPYRLGMPTARNRPALWNMVYFKGSSMTTASGAS